MEKIAKYIAFDSECTGLDSNVNNLLTVCFIVLDKDLNEIDRLNLSIKHNNYNITIKAMEVNKIDLIKHNNDVSSLDIIQANNVLIKFLKKNKNAYRLIPICHNCTFDISFIQNSGLLPKDEYSNYFSYNSVDTIVIAQYLKMCNKLSDRQSISLASLISYFGLNINDKSNFHNATYDTEMTVELLRKFVQLGISLPNNNTKKRRLEY